MVKIESQVQEGTFLHNSRYTADLMSVCAKFESDFGDAEYLIVSLKERPFHDHYDKTPHRFLDGGKKVEVVVYVMQTRDTKGRITNTPIPYDVFQSVRMALRIAAKDYREKFNKG